MGTKAVFNTGKGKMDNALQVNVVGSRKGNYMDHESKENGSFMLKKFEYGNPKIFYRNHVVVDSEADKALKDDLEKIVAQEIAAKAMDDATRQAFEEEKKWTTQDTSINKLNTGRPSVSTANTPYASATSTPTGANTGGSSFVYLRGQIPIDASTILNADLPIDPNMHDLEDDSNVFPNDGIFSGAYNDEDVGAEADFSNMDNTIDISPIPTPRVHRDHPKGQILESPKIQSNKRKRPKGLFSTTSFAGLKQCKKNASSSNYRRLVAHGLEQEEGIDNDEFLQPVARIEAIRFVFSLASIMDILSTMDVKSAFLYGTIDESQDKYVADILKKFDFCSIKTATTPIVSNKPLVKDEDGVDVDVHVYRSMIGSLMYLTASSPDIMFAVCACARFQVTPKALHLNAVKRIFRYLKHQPKLGLWYPRDSPFELEAFLDSDYGGASLDMKLTTGGCQFLGRRLISWKCKKQTIVANSTTEEEYVVAANYCGQVLWIQNQMMDYGFNFMNTKIHIDNESTICIVKNPVYHSRTKHIEIRHHFIRDCYEKRLINVIKIHTDANVADLLTKGFDVTRFNFLVVNIGMINL
ncbi:putative ribonuclease H-like domain-containing protein [Tanacetum coccineum]